MDFGNVVTAMVTPFQANGEIDYEQVRTLISHLIEHGSDSIVIAGTTGESPTLTFDEKKELFSFAVKEVNGRIPVIGGTGTNNTAESIILSQAAEEIGVDALMLVVPYYNRPSQAGMIAHFEEIAHSTELPIMIYNIPGRSGAHMEVDTVAHLARTKNIVSLKDASADLIYTSYVRMHTPADFSIYCGDDGLTIPFLSVGATGVVSVASHIIGDEMQEMVRLFKDGQVKQAQEAHLELLPIMEAMFAAPSPAPVKAALAMRGLSVGGVRLPLLPLSDEERTALQTAIK